MIYLILSAGFKDNNPDQFEKRLKIGYTDNLENRLKAYLTTNPDFILLQTREGDTSLESYLHKKFEKYRYKDSKEWFYYNQEIIDHFQDEVEDFIDEDILLECIKKDLRSRITSISDLKTKYLDQILNEIKSLDEFDEELYDEEVITRVILDAWILGINLFNKAIDNIELINYQPIDLLKIDNPEITVDITLDLPQILGRQRLLENPWKNRATLYYRSILKQNIKTGNYLKDFVDEKKSKTEELLAIYGKCNTREKHTLAETYLYVAKSKNYKDNYVAVNTHAGKDLLPVFNCLVMISEIRAFQIQQVDYKDRFTVFKTITDEFDTLDNNSIIDIVDEFNSLTLFPDKMKLLCDIKDLSVNEINSVLDLVPIVYKNYYLTLGKDKIKALRYKKNLLERGYNRILNNQSKADDLKELIYKTIEIGNRYTRQALKTIVSDIYKKSGIESTPKSTILNEYFEIKKVLITNKTTGIRENGYEILSKKENKYE